jgi:hypothetical protein
MQQLRGEPWFWAKLCTRLGCEQFAIEQFNEELFPAQFAHLREQLKTKTRGGLFGRRNFGYF